jgi:hypothetical protein
LEFFSIDPPFSGEPLTITFCSLHKATVIAIIGSRYVCWTGTPRIKRPVQDFPKSPAGKRGFLVSAIRDLHRLLSCE